MALQPGKKLISMRILPNISRSKGNQTMKYGQWIKYCGGIIPRLLFKKSKLNISLNHLSKVLYKLFLLYTKLRAREIF